MLRIACALQRDLVGGGVDFAEVVRLQCDGHGSEIVAASKGPAWRDIQISVMALPPAAHVFTMPAVTEPFLVWTTSGEAETQECEHNGPCNRATSRCYASPRTPATAVGYQTVGNSRKLFVAVGMVVTLR